jgi:hypothetical protein
MTAMCHSSDLNARHQAVRPRQFDEVEGISTIRRIEPLIAIAMLPSAHNAAASARRIVWTR